MRRNGSCALFVKMGTGVEPVPTGRVWELDAALAACGAGGCGLAPPQAKWLNGGRENQRRLQAGMVVTIEPGIYIKGWGGVRVEDMVQVTRNGCRKLTSF